MTATRPAGGPARVGSSDDAVATEPAARATPVRRRRAIRGGVIRNTVLRSTDPVDPGAWCDPDIATSSPNPRKVTSVDVARRAGVSQTTVSLVLSGKAAGRISDTTADAVRRAAR